MGGKGGSPSIKPGPLEKEQAKILRTTETQLGGPLRDIVSPQILSTLGGGGVFQTSLPGVDRDVIEQQFKQAQQGLLQTMPRGGPLQAALGNLERGRAFDVASAVNQAKQRGIERSLAVVPAFLPGSQQLAGAAAQEQQRKMANAQLQAQNQSSLGGGIGAGIGGLLGLMK